MSNKTTISIIGCGWLGYPLALFLKEKGYQVKGSSRSEEKLDFHFNMSLAAINIAQLQIAYNRNNNSTILSMNSFVRKAYNTRLVNWLFFQLPQLSSKAKFDLLMSKHPNLEAVLNFGCLTRA